MTARACHVTQHQAVHSTPIPQTSATSGREPTWGRIRGQGDDPDDERELDDEGDRRHQEHRDVPTERAPRHGPVAWPGHG